jgi:predicted amidohydrolase
MRVSVIQLAPDYALPIDERRAQAAALVRAQAGADLVVLPELWPQGGWLYDRWDAECEPLDGPTVAAMAEAARAIGAHVHAGSVLERAADGTHYNTSALLGPDGSLLASYRKIHLFGFDEGEPMLLGAGDEVVVAATAIGRIGLATCYDLRFPEMFRALVDRGAELVVVPAAWPEARVAHWTLLAQARAVENQYAVVACNTAGSQGGKAMGGRSIVVGPTGDVLGEAGEAAEVLTADVDLAEVARWREAFPVLANRRL